MGAGRAAVAACWCRSPAGAGRMVCLGPLCLGGLAAAADAAALAAAADAAAACAAAGMPDVDSGDGSAAPAWSCCAAGAWR